ncbi:hypothetical protein [Clavibacter michiganensis]|uniref:hypothetical protein n=1 Tax=Clavibacter michiganensis TaxID=28447 RepID=UPI003EBE5FCD
MSSPLARTRRFAPRRMLWVLALAAVVGLGVATSTPAGPASAAPSAPSSSVVAQSRVVTTTTDPVAASDGRVTTHKVIIPKYIFDAYRTGSLSEPARLKRAADLADFICSAYYLGTQCRIDVAKLITQNASKCAGLIAYIPQMKVVTCGL